MQRHHIHLICGSTGAGKTTYALQLAGRLGAVSFSIDEWMRTLFWMDSPQPLNADWSMERVGRCYAQMWAMAQRIAERGLPCVLDVGLTQAENRVQFAGLARNAGLTAQLHFIDVPVEERWRRVEARNAEKGDTYQFEVTRKMFDFVESIWEAPTDTEMLDYNGVHIAAVRAA
jgi:predicted kinase